MTNNKPRDVDYWGPRLREDKARLDEKTKLELIKACLLCTTPFKQEEVDLFSSPSDKLSNPEALMQYATIEGKIAEIFSSGSEDDWDENGWNKKKQYLDSLRKSLSSFYTSSELDEISSHIHSVMDANTLTVWLAGDHYIWRRVRNAYLPEITDLIGIDLETGKGKDLTEQLFREGPEDAVSRIERILGIKKEDEP